MLRRSGPRVPSRHPVNRQLFDDAPFGARIADGVTGFLGSWRFLILQSILVVFWLVGNIYLLTKPFDPYPFILLNLAFSTQAAYAAPLILLAQTRQADRDKAASERLGEMADRQREHVEGETAGLRKLLQTNTELTERIASLTGQLHAVLCDDDGNARPGAVNPGT